MKKICSILLSFILVFVLFGCGDSDSQAKKELMSKNWVADNVFYKTVYKFEDGSFIQQQYNSDNYSSPDKTYRGTYSMVDGKLTINRAMVKNNGDSDFVAVDQVYPFTFEYTFEDGNLQIDGLY